MALTRKQQEVLRWYSAGHSIKNIEHYVDMERKDIRLMLEELGVTNSAEAFDILQGGKDEDELVPSDDNLPNAGELVPEFKPETPNANKLKEYDKREIAERGGNVIDTIPMAQQQAFRMDIRWRTLSEIKHKWLTRLKTEEALQAAILEFSPSAHKRLYGED